jgi:hypothetical protein
MTAIQEGLWLVSFFGCIKLLLALPLRLFADNAGTIALSKDAANHTRTVKHIDFRYHCIHSHIETGMFSSQRLFTHRNTANIFYKMPSPSLVISLVPHLCLVEGVCRLLYFYTSTVFM